MQQQQQQKQLQKQVTPIDLILENSKLKLQIDECSAQAIDEIIELKNVYDQRLTQMKTKLERAVCDKETVRSSAAHAKQEAEKSIKNYEIINESFEMCQSRQAWFEANTAGCRHHYEVIQAEINRCQTELPLLVKSVAELEYQINMARQQIECERNYRKHLEQSNESLVNLIRQQHDANLKETKSLRLQNNSDIDKLTIRTKSVSNARLIDELDAIKQKTFEKLRTIEPVIEFVFKAELNALQLKTQHHILKQQPRLVQMLTDLSKQLNDSNGEFELLLLKKMKHEKRIDQLKHKLADLNETYARNMNEKCAQLDEIKWDLEHLVSNYAAMNESKRRLNKNIAEFYDEMHAKGINFRFYNLRSGSGDKSFK